jgi:hypothetical protein
MKVIETLDLTKLEITYCYLTEESFETFAEIKKLSQICVTYGSITNTGIIHLIKNF